MDVRVLELLSATRAVVSTRGLYRIIDRYTDEMLDEFLLEDEAEVYCDFYNGGSPDGPAVAKGYDEIWRDTA